MHVQYNVYLTDIYIRQVRKLRNSKQNSNFAVVNVKIMYMLNKLPTPCTGILYDFLLIEVNLC